MSEHWESIATMTEFLQFSSGFVFAMVALGMVRIVRGPTRADRMMAAQLLGHWRHRGAAFAVERDGDARRCRCRAGAGAAGSLRLGGLCRQRFPNAAAEAGGLE